MHESDLQYLKNSGYQQRRGKRIFFLDDMIVYLKGINESRERETKENEIKR